MEQYINKDALVAEIKKKIRAEQGYSSGDAECGYRDCARDILSFINTLEEIEAIIVETVVEMDAGGYPYTPQIELYDYEKDIPLRRREIRSK